MSNAIRSITLGQSGIGTVTESARMSAENPALVPPDRPKRKRMELSLQRKMEIVNAYSDGMSQKQISAATGIARSTVNDIVNKQASRIMEAITNDDRPGTFHRIRRASKADCVDSELYQWYCAIIAQENVVPIAPVLIRKAQSIADQLELNIIISKAWIERWKLRHNIRSRTGKQHSAEDSEAARPSSGETSQDASATTFDPALADGRPLPLLGERNEQYDWIAETVADSGGVTRMNEMSESSHMQPTDEDIQQSIERVKRQSMQQNTEIDLFGEATAPSNVMNANLSLIVNAQRAALRLGTVLEHIDLSAKDRHWLQSHTKMLDDFVNKLLRT